MPEEVVPVNPGVNATVKDAVLKKSIDPSVNPGTLRFAETTAVIGSEVPLK